MAVDDGSTRERYTENECGDRKPQPAWGLGERRMT
jgi:hypothetical protein